MSDNNSSKIYAGYRALGFTSNHIPLAVRYHQKHKENYVVTCVGNSFHTYNCSKLGITSVSDGHSEPITALAVDGSLVFTAAGNVVRSFTRNRQVIHTYTGHTASVHLLLPFGQHIISVDENSTLIVWDIQSEEQFLELPFETSSFNITALLHPSTYLNKVLLGSHQGALQLWNLRTNKLLYTFAGWQSPVTALEQAPAVDVVAIGLASGKIVLHNLKYDESVMSFTQDWGPVTTMAFRTDGNAMLATGSPLGHIALWNLEEKRLLSQIRDAHAGAVTGMKCLPSEPLLITSSPDNSLKVWIFDQPDGGGRLLRVRSGHSAPPHRVHFHGTDGQNILSAGQDSTLRSFSAVHDRHNKSLGQGSYNKAASKKTSQKKAQFKMPPITDFASEISRQSDWDNIIACHHGESLVTTWNYQRSTMGDHKLTHDRFKSNAHDYTTAQCVAISSCGNYAVIGYSSGHVDIYNMQSGLYRGSYGKDTAHCGSVRGLAIDGLNQLTITAGADSCVKFWRFKAKSLMDTVQVPAQVSRMLLHRESAMLAVALDDLGISIIDVDTRRIVRSFSGHTSSVTDMTFSSDARWLITASMDATVRTWDLPTGMLVDCFCVDSAVTSLSMSPTGSFLVTTHVDDLGVYLWTNTSLYTHVSLRPLPADYQPRLLNLPSTSSQPEGDQESTAITLQTGSDDHDYTEYKSQLQISSELVTLSLLPNSRWLSLLNLDVIKQRNKPKEPPKVPKSAPFFLPTVAGLELKFDSTQRETEEEKSQVIHTNLQALSEFGQLVSKSGDSQDYDSVMSRLKAMGPSAIDTEIRCLAPEGGGSVALMVQFLHCLHHALTTNRDFELTQAYLGLFLKLHGELVAEDASLRQISKEIQLTQEKAWQHLNQMFNQNLCLVNYLRSAVL